MKRVCWGFGDSLDQDFYAKNEGFFICFVSTFLFIYFFTQKAAGNNVEACFRLMN